MMARKMVRIVPVRFSVKKGRKKTGLSDDDFITIGICCDSHSFLCDKHSPYLYLEFSESLSGKVGCSSSIVDSSQCLIALKLERAITCDKVTESCTFDYSSILPCLPAASPFDFKQ